MREKITQYWPLFILLLISALVGFAVGGNATLSWMHGFMGFFFCAFAMLKIFNVSKFADGFQMYDMLGMRSRGYALAYPFIELALGLAYFAFFIPAVTYCLTIIIGTFSAIGVVKALQKGLDVRCACMGSVLNVPLSTVTLTEDIGMVIMAGAMLLM